uniref:Mon2 C-terminal domain-containing protein n=1 Tax=Picea sitchensis TaxID=3332 RepID=D5ACT0_PICSI|nr:unknown [Picea sitchensis]
MNRCDFILHQFLTDENDSGEAPLPSVRVEELIYVLQELARLVLHPSTASIVELPIVVKGVGDKTSNVEHTHLLVLFPSLCELVICREARVRELVQVLLRLVSTELGLGKRHS